MRTTTILCLIAEAVLCSSSLIAQKLTVLPHTSSGIQTMWITESAHHEFTRWLTAFNAPNQEVYRAFLQKEFPTGTGRIAQDLILRDNTGGFEVMRIEDESPTKITALLQERAGDYFARITFCIGGAAPYRITSLEIIPIPRPTEFPLPHLSQRKLISELQRRLHKSAETGRYSGAVLVAREGRPIFANAYGLADRERRIPNTLNTCFGIASMSKMFTGVAILQLVESGNVRLNDPLERYLPDYPNKEMAAKVTISELLTNTGGTGDIWGPVFDQHHLELRTLADFVKVYGNRPLRFEPGSRWEYSNYGFILLGRVIELVSGESYYNYMRKRIYDPAGMKATGPKSQEKGATECSIGYTRTGTGKWHRSDDTFVPGSPASVYSTVGDLLKFVNALREGKLLDTHYTQVLTAARVKNPIGFDAYGFGVQTFNGTECFGHNGASPGINGDLEICNNSEYAVISLANLDPPAAQQISEFVINRIPQQN